MKPGAINRKSAAACRRAFTLIEIMLVVGIIGLVMISAAPSIYSLYHKEGFRKVTSDVSDLLRDARQNAILQGSPTEVVFHPMENRCEMGGRAVDFGGRVAIMLFFVNQRDCKEEDAVRVRFKPNGTSDQMGLLLRSDKNEYRKFETDVMTGLTTVTAPNVY